MMAAWLVTISKRGEYPTEKLWLGWNLQWRMGETYDASGSTAAVWYCGGLRSDCLNKDRHSEDT